MSELSGKTLGDFQVGELIDEAGNASVYRGVQASTDRPVAIKALNPEVAGDKAAGQAFGQYAQAAAGMAHRNILPVLDSGQEAGVPYLVTPYLENRSVADHRSAYTNPSQVLALFQAVVSGLEYIYGQGMIHGNLRPSNIILDAQRQPQLSSFGMAFRQDETPRPYNSPEQIQGGAVDRRTDVYALGVILYELLVGHPPAAGSVANLQSLRPDLPSGIGGLIQKATAQNPDQRFQTVGELLNAFAQALQPAQAAAPAPQPAPTPTQGPAPQPPPAQKGFNWTGFFLGVILVIVLCLAVIVVGPMLAEALNPPADADQPVAEQPIQPPEEPPAEDLIPTLPAIEEPPAEQPPPDQGGEAPDQPPDEGEAGGGLPVCGSLGLASGIVLLGGIFSLKRRRRP